MAPCASPITQSSSPVSWRALVLCPHGEREHAKLRHPAKSAESIGETQQGLPMHPAPSGHAQDYANQGSGGSVQSKNDTVWYIGCRFFFKSNGCTVNQSDIGLNIHNLQFKSYTHHAPRTPSCPDPEDESTPTLMTTVALPRRLLLRAVCNTAVPTRAVTYRAQVTRKHRLDSPERDTVIRFTKPKLAKGQKKRNE